MTRKRRTHSPEFKARVALEALKELKPIHQIASENEIYPAQVAQYKAPSTAIACKPESFAIEALQDFTRGAGAAP